MDKLGLVARASRYPHHLSDDNTITLLQPDGGIYRLLVSPPAVVEAALQMAEPSTGETLCDIGSGDGRILIAAAQQYGIRAIGIERNPDLCDLSRRRIRELGMEASVEVRCQEFSADALPELADDADVLVMYHEDAVAADSRLREALHQRLATGARLILIGEPLPDLAPAATRQVLDADGNCYRLYYYRRAPS